MLELSVSACPCNGYSFSILDTVTVTVTITVSFTGAFTFIVCSEFHNFIGVLSLSKYLLYYHYSPLCLDTCDTVLHDLL